MAQSLVAVGQKITASLANWLIGKANGQGLSLLAPSSVSGTGASMTSLGTVNLSSCGSVTINGVFSSSYTNYRILIDVSLASTGHGIYLQLASGGTVNATTNYDLQYLMGAGASASAAQIAAASNWQMTITTTMLGHTIIVDLFGPAQASPCTGLVTNYGWSSPLSAGAIETMGISNRLSSAFDGVNISGGSGDQMTGTVQVFGYNVGT